MNRTLITSTIRLVAVSVLSLLGASAFGQNLNPVAFDGLRQWTGESPFVLGWGYGDVFGGGNVIDETVADFQLSGFAPGTKISSATLTFFDQVQHGGNTAQPLNVYTFDGESAIQATDWNKGAYFNSYADPYGLENLDVTAAVQSAINAGVSFLDFELTTTDPECVDIIAPPWRSPGLTLDLTVAPEPNAGKALVGCIALLLIYDRTRRSAASRTGNSKRPSERVL